MSQQLIPKGSTSTPTATQATHHPSPPAADQQAALMQYLEDRLEQWAEWYRRDDQGAMGYLSTSVEYRLMTEGTVVRTTGPKPLPIHEAAEEIEAWVVEMTAYYRPMAIALRYYYFEVGSLRKKAKQLNLSHTQLKYHVDMAKQWLLGRWYEQQKRSEE